MPNSLSQSQKAWEWIQQQPDFHSTELARVMDLPMPRVKNILDHLQRRGLIFAANTAAKPYVYKKIEGATASFSRSRPNPHKRNNKRQQIWQAMRWLEKFTVDQILSLTPGLKRQDVTRYISDLCKYSYVVRTRPGTGGRTARYLLLENTGVNYPVISKKGLKDKNRHTLVPPPAKEN